MTSLQRLDLSTAYRVFRLDAQGHAAGPMAGIEASDDEVAIKQARGLTGSLGIELWKGDRLVVWLPPTIGPKFS